MNSQKSPIHRPYGWAMWRLSFSEKMPRNIEGALYLHFKTTQKEQERAVLCVPYVLLKVDYLIICIICDTDSVNKLTLQMYTLHKYK